MWNSFKPSIRGTVPKLDSSFNDISNVNLTETGKQPNPTEARAQKIDIESNIMNLNVKTREKKSTKKFTFTALVRWPLTNEFDDLNNMRPLDYDRKLALFRSADDLQIFKRLSHLLTD